jgi:hypothetical protein
VKSFTALSPEAWNLSMLLCLCSPYDHLLRVTRGTILQHKPNVFLYIKTIPSPIFQSLFSPQSKKQNNSNFEALAVEIYISKLYSEK